MKAHGSEITSNYNYCITTKIPTGHISTNYRFLPRRHTEKHLSHQPLPLPPTSISTSFQGPLSSLEEERALGTRLRPYDVSHERFRYVTLPQVCFSVITIHKRRWGDREGLWGRWPGYVNSTKVNYRLVMLPRESVSRDVRTELSLVYMSLWVKEKFQW